MDDRTALPAGPLTLSIGLVAARIKGEYREMPGLRLTLPQAQRHFGVEATLCSLAFEQLTRDKFLIRSADGQFGQ
jgi:hypothetical protein